MSQTKPANPTFFYLAAGLALRVTKAPPHRNLLLLPVIFLACCLMVARYVNAQYAGEIKLAPGVAKLLNDPITPKDQRRAMAIFHGQWDDLTDLTPTKEASLALARFDMEHPLLSDDDVPALLRAEAALWRGESIIVVELLRADMSAQASLLKAQALEQLGQMEKAATLLEPWCDRLEKETIEDASELTAAAEALVMLARLQGRPAQDYHLAMQLFAKARDDLDRFYFPAHLAEARLLMEKDNPSATAAAALGALRLNPRSSEGWYLLGLLAVRGYDFDRADICIDQLQKINSEHLLVNLLEIISDLRQK